LPDDSVGEAHPAVDYRNLNLLESTDVVADLLGLGIPHEALPSHACGKFSYTMFGMKGLEGVQTHNMAIYIEAEINRKWLSTGSRIGLLGSLALCATF
jgi:hypothetical protein